MMTTTKPCVESLRGITSALLCVIFYGKTDWKIFLLRRKNVLHCLMDLSGESDINMDVDINCALCAWNVFYFHARLGV